MPQKNIVELKNPMTLLGRGDLSFLINLLESFNSCSVWIGYTWIEFVDLNPASGTASVFPWMLAKVALMDLHQAASQILAGSIRGRVVVNVNLTTPQLKAADSWASNAEMLTLGMDGSSFPNLKRSCKWIRMRVIRKTKMTMVDYDAI